MKFGQILTAAVRLRRGSNQIDPINIKTVEEAYGVPADVTEDKENELPVTPTHRISADADTDAPAHPPKRRGIGPLEREAEGSQIQRAVDLYAGQWRRMVSPEGEDTFVFVENGVPRALEENGGQDLSASEAPNPVKRNLFQMENGFDDLHHKLHLEQHAKALLAELAVKVTPAEPGPVVETLLRRWSAGKAVEVDSPTPSTSPSSSPATTPRGSQ